MQLRMARLCLNCDEIHDAQTCPACASENYAYLTRWVPAATRRQQPPRPKRILKPTRTQRLVFGSAVLGVAAFWLGRWSSRARARLEDAATRDAGELR
jgi:hypothetical protein